MLKKRKKMTTIKNIAESMKECDKLSQEIRRYFYYDSNLWRAIRDHIACNSQPCMIIDKEGPVHNTSAHYGIHFNRAYISSSHISGSKVQEDSITYHFDVDYDLEDDEGEKQESYSVRAPVSLELNFNEKEFKKWMLEQQKEVIQYRKERIIDQLNGIFEKHNLMQMKKDFELFYNYKKKEK